MVSTSKEYMREYRKKNPKYVRKNRAQMRDKRMENKLKKAEDMQYWCDGYVYQSQAYGDLTEMVNEYMLENEHSGNIATCKEISKDTVEDMQLWYELRKEKLIRDFILYWSEAYGINE